MKSENKTIAVLMTVHNRRDTTLKCLEKLYENNLTGLQLSVFLVDDGSTDGTRESVKKAFPDVNIIGGDGSLFWNRGMWTAWNEAAKKDYDYYLWLNDDTLIYKDAIQTMMQSSLLAGEDAIIVGSTCSASNNTVVTYGGAKGTLLFPNGSLQEVSHINGNFVLVPRFVYSKIGNLDYYYTHSFGDWDYGVRALKAGLKVLITPSFIGTCERHDKCKKCYDPQFGLYARYKNLLSPLGNPPREIFHAYSRERSPLFASKLVLANFFVILFPKLSRKLGLYHD